ncbi:MAG: hypothetical protein ACOC44_20175, partial [Promethearchaeia archaeon]
MKIDIDTLTIIDDETIRMEAHPPRQEVDGGRFNKKGGWIFRPENPFNKKGGWIFRPEMLAEFDKLIDSQGLAPLAMWREFFL